MRFKKSNLFLFIGLVLIIACAIWFLVPRGEFVVEKTVEGYKKSVYQSILCQYSCPLSEEAEVGGEIQYFPSGTCTTQCIRELKSTGFSENDFSEDELLTDDLFSDIETIMQTCRQNSVGEDDVSDNAEFYGCVKENLIGLKRDYSYLN